MFLMISNNDAYIVLVLLLQSWIHPRRCDAPSRYQRSHEAALQPNGVWRVDSATVMADMRACPKLLVS